MTQIFDHYGKKKKTEKDIDLEDTIKLGFLQVFWQQLGAEGDIEGTNTLIRFDKSSITKKLLAKKSLGKENIKHSKQTSLRIRNEVKLTELQVQNIEKGPTLLAKLQQRNPNFIVPGSLKNPEIALELETDLFRGEDGYSDLDEISYTKRN